MATFELSGKKIALVLILSIVLAVLLFATGWHAGARRGRPAADPTAADPAPEVGAAAGMPAAGTPAAGTPAAGAAPRLTKPVAPRVSGPKIPRASGPTSPRVGGSATPRVGGTAAASAATSAVAAAAAEAGEPEPESPAASPGTFTICVGSFLIAEDAELFVQDLGERGYEPWVEKIRDPEQRQVHRVMIGGWETHPEAEGAAATFAAKENIEAIAVRVRKEDQEI